MKPIKNAVCPGCTLLCDDIEITDLGPNSVAVNACEIGQAFFQIAVESKHTHSVAGQPVDLETAIRAAANILKRSKSPLICGLDQLTTEAQQSAWKLADQIGATIDTTFSNAGRSNMFALQRVGKVTATIGEIANRSDLLLFWYGDPETTHPRLLERLNKSPDHPNRRVIVIDETETRTAKLADYFVQADRDSCPAILATLRARFAETRMNESLGLAPAGLEPEVFEDLARMIGESRYGSIFYGQTTPDSAFDLVMDSLSRFIRQLNNVTRFVGMGLRTDANAQSAENVLAWSSGYPFAVNHHLNYPRFNQLEYSAETMLNRRQCDAILFATGSEMEDSFRDLSRAAREHVQSIPKIAITPRADFSSDVAIQVGLAGFDESGEFCRIDDISLPLMKAQASAEPSASVILDRIIQAC